MKIVSLTQTSYIYYKLNIQQMESLKVGFLGSGYFYFDMWPKLSCKHLRYLIVFFFLDTFVNLLF